MINEFFFIIGLFLSGFVINSLLFMKLPQWFRVISAFFVGCTNWVLISIFFWIFLNGANTQYILLIVFLESSAILVISSRINKDSLFWNGSLLFPILYFLIFGILELLFVKVNITNISRDSLTYINMGKEMVYHGISSLLLSSPKSIAYFISLMQSPSEFLGIDYLHSFQAISSASFIMFFISIVYFTFSSKIGKFFAFSLAISFIGFFFSSKLMQFMFSYIMSNNLSGIFLFIALFCFYKYYTNLHDEGWLQAAFLFLCGFCLLRIENPLPVLILLVLADKFLDFSPAEELRYLIPFITFTILVDFSLLASDILSSKTTTISSFEFVGIIFSEIIVIVYLSLKKHNFIPKVLVQNSHLILASVELIALFFTFITKTSHMYTSLKSNISTLFLTGGWGTVWVVTAIFMILIWNKVKDNFSIMIKYFVPLYYLAILLLSFFRNPYRAVWNDSANRIFVTIFYVCVFFIITSLEQITNKERFFHESLL